MAKKPTAQKPVESPVLSDKEIVLKKYPNASCYFDMGKNCFHVIEDENTFKSVHSGIAKSAEHAWKLAAHAVL